MPFLHMYGSLELFSDAHKSLPPFSFHLNWYYTYFVCDFLRIERASVFTSFRHNMLMISINISESVLNSSSQPACAYGLKIRNT